MLGSPQFLDSTSTSSPTINNNTTTNHWSNNNNNNNNNDTLLTATVPSTSNPYTPNALASIGDPILFSPTTQQQRQMLDPATISIAKMENSPKSNAILTPPTPSSLKKHQLQRHNSSSNSVSLGYANATKPFSYADGYHYLINYVRQK